MNSIPSPENKTFLINKFLNTGQHDENYRHNVVVSCGNSSNFADIGHKEVNVLTPIEEVNCAIVNAIVCAGQPK